MPYRDGIHWIRASFVCHFIQKICYRGFMLREVLMLIIIGLIMDNRIRINQSHRHTPLL